MGNNELSLSDYGTGATVTTMLCQLSTNTCLVLQQIEGRNDHDPYDLSAVVRVGECTAAV